MEEVGGDFFFVAAEVDAVGGFDGGVEGVVGVAQVGGHFVGVVEGGEGCAGVCGAGVKDALGAAFYVLFLCVAWLRPDEVVVDHAAGITVTAFQPAAYGAHPSVVKLAVEYAEMVECGVGNKKNKVRT